MNDVTEICYYSRCLLFAGDLKMFKPIKTILDVGNLQRDLDTLLSWCEVNNLDLNVNKCKCMSRVSEIHDLGVLYDEKITFVRYIDYTISKAYSMLGLMMGIRAEFDNPLALKSVYYSHVRSYLENGCVVWYPHHGVHIDLIEPFKTDLTLMYFGNLDGTIFFFF